MGKGTFTGDRKKESSPHFEDLKTSEKLAEEQKAYLRGKRYENEKNKHGGERPSDQNEHLKTSEN